MLTLILLAECRGKLRLSISDSMALIDNDILPVEFAESRLVIQDVLVCGEHDVELFVLEELGKGRTLVLLALVCDDTNRRCPLLELVYPVRDGHERDYDEVRTFISFVADKIGKE